MSPIHNGSNRIDGPENVRHMGERHDLGAFSDNRVQVVKVEAAIISDADPAQGGACAASQLLPWNEVRVVLHLSDDDLVTLAESEPRSNRRVGAIHRAGSRGIAERVGHEIQGLGGVLGEHHLLGLRTDETGHGLTCGLIGVSGFFGQLVCTAVNCGVVLLVEGALGIEHLSWFVRRRAGVEIHQRLSAAHRARQDGEVAADSGRLRLGECLAQGDVGHGGHQSRT